MPGSVLARLDRALFVCETTFVAVAIASASILLFVNVVMRYVFLAALSWAEEVTMYVIVWLVFVGGSVTLRTVGHISIDLLPLALSEAGARRLRIFVCAAMLVFLRPPSSITAASTRSASWPRVRSRRSWKRPCG